MYGKPCKQNRSIGFFSDTSRGYEYSGQLAKSQPLGPVLSVLLHTINNMYDAQYNGILVNRYASGKESIGKHSDDEKNLDASGVIAISVGAIRKFRIRKKFPVTISVDPSLEKESKFWDIPTTPYHLLRMVGDFQKEFTHEIPKELTIHEPRISFTFRRHTDMMDVKVKKSCVKVDRNIVE